MGNRKKIFIINIGYSYFCFVWINVFAWLFTLKQYDELFIWIYVSYELFFVWHVIYFGNYGLYEIFVVWHVIFLFYFTIYVSYWTFLHFTRNSFLQLRSIWNFCYMTRNHFRIWYWIVSGYANSFSMWQLLPTDVWQNHNNHIHHNSSTTLCFPTGSSILLHSHRLAFASLLLVKLLLFLLLVRQEGSFV